MEFSYRNAPSAITGISPFFANKGYYLNISVYPEYNICYDLKSLEWDSKTTLVLSNTRELDRVPKTK